MLKAYKAIKCKIRAFHRSGAKNEGIRILLPSAENFLGFTLVFSKIC